MTKDIIEKVKGGGILSVNDLTPAEKIRLYELFDRYELCQSTCYRRLFEKGFDKWEIEGISKVQNEFLLTELCGTDDNGEGEEGSRGYGYVLTQDGKYDRRDFYRMVTDLKIGIKLCEFMAARGMKSQVTVRTRFAENSWKLWELKGVRAILDEFTEGNDNNE